MGRMHSTSCRREEADGSATRATRQAAGRTAQGTRATHEHALSGLGVVERGLDDVVGERVAQELLEAVAVEELGDEGLACLGLSDADALLDDVGRELLDRERADVAEELARDGIAEAVVVEVEDVLLRETGEEEGQLQRATTTATDGKDTVLTTT